MKTSKSKREMESHEFVRKDEVTLVPADTRVGETSKPRSNTHLATSVSLSGGRMLVCAAGVSTAAARSVRCHFGSSRVRPVGRGAGRVLLSLISSGCLLGRGAAGCTRVWTTGARLRLLILGFGSTPGLLLFVIQGSSSAAASDPHGAQVGQRPLDASPGCRGRYDDGLGTRSRLRRRLWLLVVMHGMWRRGTGARIGRTRGGDGGGCCCGCGPSPPRGRRLRRRRQRHRRVMPVLRMERIRRIRIRVLRGVEGLLDAGPAAGAGRGRGPSRGRRRRGRAPRRGEGG